MSDRELCAYWITAAVLGGACLLLAVHAAMPSNETPAASPLMQLDYPAEMEAKYLDFVIGSSPIVRCHRDVDGLHRCRRLGDVWVADDVDVEGE